MRRATAKTQFTGADQRTWDENWPELQLAPPPPPQQQGVPQPQPSLPPTSPPKQTHPPPLPPPPTPPTQPHPPPPPPPRAPTPQPAPPTPPPADAAHDRHGRPPVAPSDRVVEETKTQAGRRHKDRWAKLFMLSGQRFRLKVRTPIKDVNEGISELIGTGEGDGHNIAHL
ncbi:mulatexin-like [Drosophila santomea]|uniref:mulatexin-like n=1 Tax=Drosophila santomea TaxID=129105 RepID=UPI001CCBA3FA|nr:mulatexin-like [Drosophila santomea]